MIFDILGSGKGKNPFPGYQLKVGELCSLPALSTNDSSARALSIPTGCIPLCVKVEPEFRANSGNGETPNLYIVIYDNNNIIMHGETVPDGFLAEVRHSIYAR